MMNAMNAESKVKVSVITITYNQEKFIRDTIEGILKQETDFKFELIIHDDASTDGTADTIRHYAERYPGIIKPIFEKRNQFEKGTYEFLNDMFRQAQGEYIAMCEGDDYWTDSHKLQRQVDFLEADENYALCFHAVKIVYEDGSEDDRISPLLDTKKKFTIKNLLKDNFIYTCTVMYRSLSYHNLAHSMMPMDLYIHLFHAQNGKIGFIDDVMAVYRKQPNGVWWDSKNHMESIFQKYRFQTTNLFSELLKMFQDNRDYTKIIYGHLDHLFTSFSAIDKKNKSNLLESTARDFPFLVARFINNRINFIDTLKVENKRLLDLSSNQETELRMIKESRWYRLNPGRFLK